MDHCRRRLAHFRLICATFTTRHWPPQRQRAAQSTRDREREKLAGQRAQRRFVGKLSFIFFYYCGTFNNDTMGTANGAFAGKQQRRKNETTSQPDRRTESSSDEMALLPLSLLPMLVSVLVHWTGIGTSLPARCKTSVCLVSSRRASQQRASVCGSSPAQSSSVQDSSAPPSTLQQLLSGLSN